MEKINEMLDQAPTELQLTLAEFVRRQMANERSLAVSKPYLFSLQELRLLPDTNIPKSIVESVAFQNQFGKLLGWLDSFRELRIETESVSSPQTKNIVLTTPEKLFLGIWKNQSFSVNGVNLGFALAENNGVVQEVQQGMLTAKEIRGLTQALNGAYEEEGSSRKVEETDFERWESTSRNEINLARNIFESNPHKFEEMMADGVITTQRLMTNEEMESWLEKLRKIPTHPRRVCFSRLWRGFSLDFGLHLVEQYTDQEGNPKFEPSVIVPVHFEVDGKSVWSTATLIFKNRVLTAVNFNHGNRHLIQIRRALEPGSLF